MAELIAGRAGREETTAFATRSGRAAEQFRAFGEAHLSSLGLGTYLGHDDERADQGYRACVARALELGVNVFDTAVNYRSQRSERAIGTALKEAVRAGRKREEFFVSTKGGFLPFDGSTPADPRGWIEKAYVRSGMLKPEEIVAGCHSLAPRFIADQVQRSRTNLGLATIDLYYLHNPETQLDEVGPQELRQRLRRAFEVMEAACAQDQVAAFGVATWHGFRDEPEAGAHLSLEELVDLAREVAGAGHHFKAVQLPFNLAMPEAFALETQRLRGQEVSLLEAAHELGIYVFASASLMQGKLTRNLPRSVQFDGLASDAQRALQFVRSVPGVGTALAGMSRLEHLEENAGVLAVAPLDEEKVRSLFG